MRKAASNEIVIGHAKPVTNKEKEPVERVITPSKPTTTVAHNNDATPTTVPTRKRSSSLLTPPDTTQGVQA